jgi:hypothetical protein
LNVVNFERYLKGIVDYGIFRKGNNIELEAFVDIDWVNDIKLKSSSSGYLFKIKNSPISCRVEGNGLW